MKFTLLHKIYFMQLSLNYGLLLCFKREVSLKSLKTVVLESSVLTFAPQYRGIECRLTCINSESKPVSTNLSLRGNNPFDAITSKSNLSVADTKRLFRANAAGLLLYAENNLFNPTLSENDCRITCRRLGEN